MPAVISPGDNHVWYADVGITRHICNRIDWMYDLQEPPIHEILTSTGQSLPVEKIGKVSIKTTSCGVDRTIRVTGVVYVPLARKNVLSICQLKQKRCIVEVTDEGCTISKDGTLLAKGITDKYKLDTVNLEPIMEDLENQLVI